ncbi:MAG TPA: hypothetical protein VMB25_13110 [Bryobacteraceae bacterium]|nr:hypothetical protein [Bryobacteraceae bacterium]
MFREWLNQEHQRLHIVEEWPDGPQKEAALGSIRSKLKSLLIHRGEENVPPCLVCQNRKLPTFVTPDAKKFQIETERTTEWAA